VFSRPATAAIPIIGIDLGQDNFVFAVKQNVSQVRDAALQAPGATNATVRAALKSNQLRIRGRFHRKLTLNERREQKEKSKTAQLGTLFNNGLGGPLDQTYVQTLAALNGYRKRLVGPYAGFRGAQSMMMGLGIQ
jgi:hypothetical protein